MKMPSISDFWSNIFLIRESVEVDSPQNIDSMNKDMDVFKGNEKSDAHLQFPSKGCSTLRPLQY